MKRFSLVFFLFAVIVSTIALTDDQKEKLRKHNEECIEETNIDADKVKKFRAGDWTVNDEESHKYWFCMFKKSGTITDEGHFELEVAKSTVSSDNPQKQEIQDAMTACKDKHGTTREETAYLIMKCFHEILPGHDMF